ncbi:MAG: acyl-CoA dehydrogenase family protein [candidate division WOR-3 bacterium]
MGLIKFNNEQKLIENEIRKFAVQEIEPISQKIEKDGRIPEGIFKKLMELGLLAPIIPLELGGAGMDTTSLCIIIEELSKYCASLGLVIAVNNGLGSFTLLKLGLEKAKPYLTRLINGEIVGFSYDGESKDLEIVQENPLIINGKRRFVFNGELANFFLFELNTEKGSGLFVIEKSASKQIEIPYSLGMKGAGIADIVFEKLQISEESRLIDGVNFIKAMEGINSYFNLCLSAIALGIAQAGLDASIKYSKERRQFNRPICEFPMVREMLAEMKIKIESARNLVYDAANRVDSGEDYILAADIALATAAETAVYCGIKSVQVFGGYGYTKDYPVERYLRDAKSIQVIGRSGFVLKEKIVRNLLG